MSLARRRNEWTEALRIAGWQLGSHKVRSLLTALGVIIGILAVTLMGTAIKGIDRGFEDSLAMLGRDLLYIERFPWRDVGGDWPLYANRGFIRLDGAEQLNEWIRSNPDSLLRLAVPVKIGFLTIEQKDRSISGVYTNGTTSDFAEISTAEIEFGRFFSYGEDLSGAPVAVLGREVADALFPAGAEKAVGERVTIKGRHHRVVGVFEEQGSFLGKQSFDKQIVLPLEALKRFFLWDRFNAIRVQTVEGADMDLASDELTGLYRRVRGLLPEDKEDFEINRSEAVEERLGPVKAGLALAGFFITGLALFVGAIGIMNITFVSVKERTREIGTRRAIGARRGAILLQFLAESVSICLLGGLAGLALAFACKTVIARAFPAFPFTFSADLVLIAFLLSVGTGVVSGLAPAWQAARLDPARALRHE